jgi:hypothetical protein
LVWDHRYRQRLADCPVVLNFAGEQVELCHQEFDDLSITWNTIVPTAPIEWSDVDDDNSGPRRLEWRTDADPRLAALHGCRLEGIALLEWRDHISDIGNGSLAITFDFGREQVTITNGLDENALRIRST